MKNFYFLAAFSLLIFSCTKKTETKLTFLDEYDLADSIQFKNTIIGGLSGVDFVNNQYYFVVDDERNPRVLSANISISDDKIKSVKFNDVILLADTTNNFYQKNALDLESVFVDETTNEIYLTSEGSIKNNKLPSVFKSDINGRFLEEIQLPENLLNIKSIKHNAAFEASSKSIDNKGFWVAMEAPLNVDGEEPTFTKTSSPIRITYFDKSTKKATKQFAYQLEHITKPAKGNINLNGVTAMLEYKENQFLVVERTYQSGYGSHGNIVRIFDVIVDETATDILEIDALKTSEFTPLKKRLVFNFEDVEGELTDKIIDNIEGIAFGPELLNGNKSLLLISDDNFQFYGKQLNQFILLELQAN
ncbi:esterase-like activity of phytase family protein [Polaribacter sp. KT25b]|uniref:esterase-like activity of phytase family protein n=1 Tax=Polaribacter sp. KT25b TaxID=1855336 RepID=UPI0012FDE082|nr:esterase-like activity of phytase family protein [Polaribacter sp. KT25b]